MALQAGDEETTEDFLDRCLVRLEVVFRLSATRKTKLCARIPARS